MKLVPKRELNGFSISERVRGRQKNVKRYVVFDADGIEVNESNQLCHLLDWCAAQNKSNPTGCNVTIHELLQSCNGSAVLAMETLGLTAGEIVRYASISYCQSRHGQTFLEPLCRSNIQNRLMFTFVIHYCSQGVTDWDKLYAVARRTKR